MNNYVKVFANLQMICVLIDLLILNLGLAFKSKFNLKINSIVYIAVGNRLHKERDSIKYALIDDNILKDLNIYLVIKY